MYFNRKALEKIQADRLDLGVRKNRDYSSVVDSVEACGTYGLATRIFDKACRFLSMAKEGGEMIHEESMRDTLTDLANYADYGTSLIDGTWGKKEEEKEEEELPF